MIPEKFMKKIKHLALKAAIYGIAAAALIGGGWWGYNLYQKTSSVEVEIEKVAVSRGDLETKFQDIGDVYPKDILEVYSRVSGRIDQLLAVEGSTVRKGDKLAVVKPGQSETDKYLPVDVAAPISGTVMSCVGNRSYYGSESTMAKVDQRISGLADSGNPTCLMQIADFSRMIVKLSVSEMEVLKLKQNLPVKVTIDALPSMGLSGRISLISPKSSDGRGGTKSFSVEVMIDQKNLNLKSGMTARIEAVMESRKNALKMPLSGLFEERGRRFAYLYTPGGKSRKTDLKIGLRNETEVEILGGLSEGATVYTDKPINVEDDKK
jgi:multidrug efflux pump subunit AcrA (membrane-fusion protein)